MKYLHHNTNAHSPRSHEEQDPYKKGYNCHPVMVSVEQGIKQAERMLNQYKLDGIFLATDDQEILEQYIDYFGNKINFFSDVIRGSSDVSIAFVEKPRKCHHYNLGKDDNYILFYNQFLYDVFREFYDFPVFFLHPYQIHLTIPTVNEYRCINCIC